MKSMQTTMQNFYTTLVTTSMQLHLRQLGLSSGSLLSGTSSCELPSSVVDLLLTQFHEYGQNPLAKHPHQIDTLRCAMKPSSSRGKKKSPQSLNVDVVISSHLHQNLLQQSFTQLSVHLPLFKSCLELLLGPDQLSSFLSSVEGAHCVPLTASESADLVGILAKYIKKDSSV